MSRSLSWSVILLTAVLVLGGAGWLPAAHAQGDPGAICISTFADLNGNGLADEGETTLAGVNANLATGDAIIATHITAAGEEQYCFEGLLPGVYTLTFTDSPTYHPTTSTEGTFALSAGQRLGINAFGAVPVSSEDLRDEVASMVAASDPDEPLAPSSRLVVSGIASMVVMLFMIAVGAVVLGMTSRRKAKRRTPPPPGAPTAAPPPPR
ncbi:SdrD B-like domain-containing protein [Aggregatilinea lenta]|uniref:SdrD B-like domain-containing protein n=1 Tax=Aggregatilinea lenta TaxID=913108 RepID=UPI0013C3505D|nr:SdrD B-like domain-containing protein [Aggregatilinea lenta]